MRIAKTLVKIGSAAKRASTQLALANQLQKNNALIAIANSILANRDKIEEANQIDLEEGKCRGLSSVLLDRLSLQGRVGEMVDGIQAIAEMQDPIGEIIEEQVTPTGLKIKKQRVPIGVLGIIYESRPNVTVDVASLALKTGNCAILRGGSETMATNRILVELIQKALEQAKLPSECIQLVMSLNRSWVRQLLIMDSYIDMIIPRGGTGLHKFCKDHSTIPVVTGGIGICHLYVDASAKQDQALDVIINAKTDRPSVCNALDTLLIDRKIASEFLPQVVERLKSKGVSFRLDAEAKVILGSDYQLATEQDWHTEWLSLVLGIRVVDSLETAIQHIRRYGSGHSDGILTETAAHREAFLKQVDSAVVYVNASTRFTDGAQFGMGAEIAISTQKLHARGPMGLRELTTYKWIVEGQYHVRNR